MRPPNRGGPVRLYLLRYFILSRAGGAATEREVDFVFAHLGYTPLMSHQQSFSPHCIPPCHGSDPGRWMPSRCARQQTWTLDYTHETLHPRLQYLSIYFLHMPGTLPENPGFQTAVASVQVRLPQSHTASSCLTSAQLQWSNLSLGLS